LPAFHDQTQLEDTIGSLFRALLEDADTRKRFAAAGVTVQFVMTQPDGVITVAPDGVSTGERLAADVTMTMKADTAHAFWLGEITLPRAMASGDIKAEGPVAKILGLLPLLKPAYRLYPKLARSKGVDVE